MTDFEHLIWLGQQLDARPAHYSGRTGQELLMPSLLRIRNRAGALAPLAMNRAQIELARDRSSRKIILKARQLGITTWVAARFFLRTITHPGPLAAPRRRHAGFVARRRARQRRNCFGVHAQWRCRLLLR